MQHAPTPRSEVIWKICRRWKSVGPWGGCIFPPGFCGEKYTPTFFPYPLWKFSSGGLQILKEVATEAQFSGILGFQTRFAPSCGGKRSQRPQCPDRTVPFRQTHRNAWDCTRWREGFACTRAGARDAGPSGIRTCQAILTLIQIFSKSPRTLGWVHVASSPKR